MQSVNILRDAFGRIPGLAHRAARNLDAAGLSYQPDPDANSIAWLIWHMTRIQDDHIAGLADREQTWTADGWAQRLNLPFSVHDTGYGHTSQQVASLRPATPDDLLGYHDATAARTMEYLGTIDDDALDQVIDRSWNPPVTAGVRLVSVIGDCHQHVGQANYLRGIVDRL